MVYLAALAAVVVVILIQTRIYKKHMFDNLEYKAFFSSDEVHAGDDVYLYEEISNTGRLPLPYIKIDTDLPDGLEFVLLESKAEREQREKEEALSGRKKETGFGRKKIRVSASVNGILKKSDTADGLRSVNRVKSIQSLFVLRSYSTIRRRWRVYCKKRGEYTLTGALVTGNNLLGTEPQSKRFDLPENTKHIITVLPNPENLAGNYASSRYLCGDAISNLCPVTDPVRTCGTREYSEYDPMNRVNWKSTAAHGKLMSNIEEKTVRHRFSILLNMNSREIEQNPEVPSDRDAIERCIIICASVIERAASEDMPVSLFFNCPPDALEEAKPVTFDDEIGRKISVCGPFRGRKDILPALRTAAAIPMSISVPAEKMFDHICQRPELYSENENLIVISSYIDGRMRNFAKSVETLGVKTVFYIATSRNDIGEIPDDMDVYFSL